MDRCFRELFQKHFAQGIHHVLLLVGTGVFGATVAVEATNVADADAVGVVVFDVCSFLFQWSAGMDAAILIDDVVVANTIPLSGSVPAVDVCNCHLLIGFCRGTVKDD